MLICQLLCNGQDIILTKVHNNNRGEYPTLIYCCRMMYHKVMMQQEGFVACYVLEVKNYLKLLALLTLRTAIFVNGYARNTFTNCLDP